MKKGYAKSSMKIFGPLLLCDYIKYSILGKIGLPTFFFSVGYGEGVLFKVLPYNHFSPVQTVD